MSEDTWKAARYLAEAADTAKRAADRLDESTRTLRHLFEDGYGGNALKLIELFEKAEQQSPGVVIPDDNAILALQFCKDKLIRKLAKLQPTNNGQYYPDDIDQFVKVAKAIVGEMDE